MPLHLMNEQRMSTRSAEANSFRNCETRLGSSRVPARRHPRANGVSGRSGFARPISRGQTASNRWTSPGRLRSPALARLSRELDQPVAKSDLLAKPIVPDQAAKRLADDSPEVIGQSGMAVARIELLLFNPANVVPKLVQATSGALVDDLLVEADRQRRQFSQVSGFGHCRHNVPVALANEVAAVCVPRSDGTWYLIGWSDETPFRMTAFRTKGAT